MASVGAPVTSGNWVVSEGKEEEFTKAWTQFVEWTLENFPDGISAFLIQQNDDPRHFVSVGQWADKNSVAKWRGHPDFPKMIGAARSLCDEFVALDYTVAASAGK